MALNTSAVVGARGMLLLYSLMGICQAKKDSVARTGDVLCLTASQRLQLENRAKPVRKAVSQLRAAAESAIRERLERAASCEIKRTWTE